MSLDSFFNILYQIALIIMVITFGLGFIHAYLSEDDSEG